MSGDDVTGCMACDLTQGRQELPGGRIFTAEASELGPLLQRLAATVRGLQQADQVYVCLWSHAGWLPGHIHFVVQPSWERMKAEHARPGPFLQGEQFDANATPPREEVEAFAEKARESLASGTGM